MENKDNLDSSPCLWNLDVFVNLSLLNPTSTVPQPGELIKVRLFCPTLFGISNSLPKESMCDLIRITTKLKLLIERPQHQTDKRFCKNNSVSIQSRVRSWPEFELYASSFDGNCSTSKNILLFSESLLKKTGVFFPPNSPKQLKS